MEREKFYQSRIWKNVRRNVWLKQSCLCSRCGRAVYVDGLSSYIPKEKRLKGIVHHKVYLNDINIYDDAISISEDNLEGLCIDCHNNEHFKTDSVRKDVKFDDNGNLISVAKPPYK
jgi:5-methylcytosine-specific restriction endonuclease McrA